MGCGLAKTPGYEVHEKVEKQLKRDKETYNSEIKLLLLGTGESGKSTIAKQMRIIHSNGFSHDELTRARTVLVANTMIAMRTLVEAAKKLNYEIQPENKGRASYFENLVLRTEEVYSGVLSELKPEYTSPEMVENISRLWADSGIQKAYENRNLFQLMDSAKYCFDHFSKFADPNFNAAVVDLLHARERTNGIVETTFDVKETNFRMVDVGGQRSERKKWIHCFEDVTAIIYCVALNEYDMKLWEDQTVNRMKESLELFEEICNSKWFTKTAIILFLNKEDLFRDKIQRVDLNVCFPEYTGGKDYEKAKQFIQDQFINLNRSKSGKKIYAHTTTATDTENVRVVFNVAREVIISQNFANLGFGSI